MFCPVCKAQYREGFYRCAECDVELVSALSEGTRQESEPAEADEEGWVLLARGDDRVFLTALVSALEEASLPHQETALGDFHSSLSRSFPAHLNLGRGYEVRVPQTDLVAAKNVLVALEQKAAEEEAGAPVAEQAQEEPDAEGEVPEDWDPLGATSEVWVGSDPELARFLRDTLRENGVGCCPASDSVLRLLVHPEDTARARAIVREVLEGTPPA